MGLDLSGRGNFLCSSGDFFGGGMVTFFGGEVVVLLRELMFWGW